jgi:hypothetical protein
LTPQKVSIVALVVIVMLYLVTLGLGAGRGSSSDGGDPVAFLKGLQPGRFLRIDDGVTASGCAGVTPGTLTVPTPCAVDVPERGFPSMPTRVALVPSGPLKVTVVPRRGPHLEETLGGGDCLGAALDRHGGTIALTPVLPGTVAVTLLNESCPES